MVSKGKVIFTSSKEGTEPTMTARDGVPQGKSVSIGRICQAIDDNDPTWETRPGE